MFEHAKRQKWAKSSATAVRLNGLYPAQERLELTDSLHKGTIPAPQPRGLPDVLGIHHAVCVPGALNLRQPALVHDVQEPADSLVHDLELVNVVHKLRNNHHVAAGVQHRRRAAFRVRQVFQSPKGLDQYASIMLAVLTNGAQYHVDSAGIYDALRDIAGTESQLIGLGVEVEVEVKVRISVGVEKECVEDEDGDEGTDVGEDGGEGTAKANTR